MAYRPEKRRIPRIQPFVTPCRVSAGERRLSGYLIDLSPQGARVSTEVPPPASETIVVLEVRLGARAARSRLPGRVKWIQPADDGHVFGVVFEGLSAEAERALEGVVEEFKKRAAALEPGG